MPQSALPSNSQVPIANLLRIAFLAGGLLEELEDCEASHDEGKSFDELLQAMLARAAERIRLRGFERGYSQAEEITTRPRGRIAVSRSIAACTIPMRRLACEFDEFGPDTPHNRVLKACARTLVRCDKSSVHQDSLRALVREMREVSDVALSRRMLQALPRSIATRRYRVVRFIARLLVDAGQPDARIGTEWARRLLQDESAMRGIFERFVRRFGRAHRPAGVAVRPSRFLWSASPQKLVPTLITDVTVEARGWTRIIECKYMRSHATHTQHGTEMFHPEHLRQIFAYLSRARDTAQSPIALDGVVLYPAFDAAASHTVDLGEFRVRVVQLSLDQPWSALCGDLRGLLFARGS
jgi:5-methylcytosine-specific restriction enzyme subunit McrC